MKKMKSLPVRKRHTKKNRRAVFIAWTVIIIFFLILVGSVAFSIVSDYSEKKALREQGTSSLGIVFDRYTTGVSGRSTGYAVSYHYTPEGSNDMIEALAVPVTPGEWKSISEGDTVDITYLPSNTSISQLTSSLTKIPSDVSRLLALVVVFFGIFLFTWMHGRLEKMYNARHLGRRERWMKIVIGVGVLVLSMSMSFAAGVLVFKLLSQLQ